MKTKKEIREEIAKHQEWLDEWGGEGASEEGQEVGWLEALEWVLSGEEAPENQYGVRWNAEGWSDTFVTQEYNLASAKQTAELYREDRGAVVVTRAVGKWEEMT